MTTDRPGRLGEWPHGRRPPRERHRGAHGIGEQAVADDDFGAGLDVDRIRPERCGERGQPAIAEHVLKGLTHPPLARHVQPPETPLGPSPVVALPVVGDAVEVRNRGAARAKPADQAAHRASRDRIDGNACALEHVEHADVGPAPRAPAAER